ncbi:MAG: membrane protein insertase YidC [Verrucomicrobia bacterium]|nr:membrane protein insertase YidC [Verrucomicrobiota bacterium]
MNRKDLPVLVVLVGLIVLLPMIDRALIAPRFRKAAPPAQTHPTNAAPVAVATAAAEVRATPEIAAAAGTSTVAHAMAAPADEPPSDRAATFVTLTNGNVALRFSSHGAALVSATLKDYPLSQSPTSGPVVLDFAAAPALAYEGIGGLGDAYSFEARPGPDGRSVRFERRNARGLQLVRTVDLATNGYTVLVRDEFQNGGAAPVHLSAAWLRFGEMGDLPGETKISGIAFLGIDTLSPGDKAQFWGGKLAGLYKKAAGEGRPPAAVVSGLPMEDKPADWAAVKNKYFVQLLKPDERFERIEARMARIVGPNDGPKARIDLAGVSAAALCAPCTVTPAEPVVRTYELYVGPKKYDVLNRLDARRVDVMEFGWAGAIGKILLAGLNLIHSLIPNYGLAILLLTVVIRILFWPLTHKSTESMKRMQEVAPLIKELQAKYKDDPKRQQQATMQLYKEKKINPLSGCLPILVQLPVLIALFVVLRGAIELRFSPFLWIADLSEPENLLAGMLPFGLALNPLPLIMTAMQVWQTKLTPAAGDPAQQKMMLWMPVVMLYFFYGFPAGLVLYWTTNQALMIAQMLRQRMRTAAKAKGATKP